MGKNFFKDKYNLLFLGFMIFYIFLLNYNLDYTLGWDESRHSIQGHIFYDYFSTILDGDFVSYSDFVDEYSEKGINPGLGYNIDWYAYFDPPVHAIFQSFIFLIMGASVFTARLANHILILILSPLMYIFASKILESKLKGLVATALFLTSFVAFKYGSMVYLSVPISLLMVGWFYFLLYKKAKNVSIKISDKIKIRFDINLLISSIFLFLATFMKYHSMIYAVAFIFLYCVYLLFKDFRKTDEKKFFKKVIKTRAWSLGWKFVFQIVFFLVIGSLWLKRALLEQGLWERVFFEGAGRGRVYSLNFFLEFIEQSFTKTSFAGLPDGFGIYAIFSSALFVLIALLLYFKKDSFCSKNPRIMIYLLALYLTATLLISNKQLRYLIHAMPFFFIVATQGIWEVSEFIRKKANFKHAFIVLSVILIALSVNVDVMHTKDMRQAKGDFTDELTQKFKELPNPKILLNIQGKVSPRETGYYSTPDLFIFEAMLANPEHNPKYFEQYASYVTWGQIMNDYERFLEQVSTLNSQVSVIPVMFKFDAEETKMVDTVSAKLAELGFEKEELEWYYVFRKEQ